MTDDRERMERDIESYLGPPKLSHRGTWKGLAVFLLRSGWRRQDEGEVNTTTNTERPNGTTIAPYDGTSQSCNLAGCNGTCGICTPSPEPEDYAGLRQQIAELREFVRVVYDFRADRAIEEGEMPFGVCDYYTMEDLLGITAAKAAGERMNTQAKIAFEVTDGKFLRSVAAYVPGDGRSRILIRERLFRLASLVDIHQKTGQLLQHYADELKAMRKATEVDDG